MSTRSSARRRRGSQAYKASMKRQMPAPRPKAGIDPECVPDEPTREALERWPRIFGETLFVYFVQAREGGPVKVGKAVDPIARLRELQCANASQLVIRSVIVAKQDTERMIHRSWGEVAHVRGEWFGNGYEDMLLAMARAVCEEQLQGVTQDYVMAVASTVAYPKIARDLA